MSVIIKKQISHFLRNVRTISTIKVDNYTENIYTTKDYPLNKCLDVLKNDQISVIGYGPQGRGQSLNLRDNNFNVILGLRKGNSWDMALNDGWQPNVNLFEIDEATYKGTIICNLLSDAGQVSQWDVIKNNLHVCNTLYFSHGFGLTFSEITNIDPPNNIDIVMVSPKGSGLTLRDKYLNGLGLNSSFAIEQNYTDNAFSKTLSLAFGIGSKQAFETTFKKEVYSDLVGERCVLMGLIQGVFMAQYKLLRNKGHSPCEAYNETVEEALDSLYPLINEKGMDYLYRNCSTTAQRGAIDWAPIFEQNVYPIMEKCYEQVVSGEEAKKVIQSNTDIDYRNKLNKELDDISNSELWTVSRQYKNIT